MRKNGLLCPVNAGWNIPDFILNYERKLAFGHFYNCVCQMPYLSPDTTLKVQKPVSEKIDISQIKRND
jgi:hypothetical protein